MPPRGCRVGRPSAEKIQPRREHLARDALLRHAVETLLDQLDELWRKRQNLRPSSKYSARSSVTTRPEVVCAFFETWSGADRDAVAGGRREESVAWWERLSGSLVPRQEVTKPILFWIMHGFLDNVPAAQHLLSMQTWMVVDGVRRPLILSQLCLGSQPVRRRSRWSGSAAGGRPRVSSGEP